MKQLKSYNFLLLPPSQQRYKSLKASHSRFNRQLQLAKRQSLDSKPIYQMRKQQTLQNIEDVIYSNQVVQGLGKKLKAYLQDTNKTNYFWKKKQPKPIKVRKAKSNTVKRTWSVFGKNVQQKNRSHFGRSKDDNTKINISDRFSSKNEFLHKISNETGCTSKSYHSKNQIKKAKSLFNSTMLTKRDSEEYKETKESKYEHLIFNLRKILNKYQLKVLELKEQRDNYRSKYKRATKKLP